MNVIVIGLYVLGFLLILIEVFVPGGIFAVAGVACIVAGVFLQEDDLTTALWKMALVVLLLGLILPFALRILRRTEVFHSLTREEALTNEAGFQSRAKNLSSYLGREAIALTDLRPAGTVEVFDGKRLDVTTRGDYIERGSKVEIYALDGTWLIVRKV